MSGTILPSSPPGPDVRLPTGTLKDLSFRARPLRGLSGEGIVPLHALTRRSPLSSHPSIVTTKKIVLNTGPGTTRHRHLSPMCPARLPHGVGVPAPSHPNGTVRKVASCAHVSRCGGTNASLVYQIAVSPCILLYYWSIHAHRRYLRPCTMYIVSNKGEQR